MSKKVWNFRKEKKRSTERYWRRKIVNKESERNGMLQRKYAHEKSKPNLLQIELGTFQEISESESHSTIHS